MGWWYNRVAAMTARELAAAILDEAVVQIQANMAQHYQTGNGERWVNASGRSSEAFKVESDEKAVRLVYRGEDVAPLSTIQHGTTGIPPISVIEKWMGEKGIFPPDLSPWAIRTNMKKRGGSERHIEEQDWILTPPIEEAVRQLNERLPQLIAKEVAKDII